MDIFHISVSVLGCGFNYVPILIICYYYYFKYYFLLKINYAFNANLKSTFNIIYQVIFITLRISQNAKMLNFLQRLFWNFFVQVKRPSSTIKVKLLTKSQLPARKGLRALRLVAPIDMNHVPKDLMINIYLSINLR